LYYRCCIWIAELYFSIIASPRFIQPVLFENCGLTVGGISPGVCCYGGVYITLQAEGVSIVDSKARNCFQGFVFEDASAGGRIAGCKAEGCEEAGIRMHYSRGASIESNYLINNKYGIYLHGDARFNRIIGNFCTLNDVYGIYVPTRECLIEGNVCYRNGDAGIFIDGLLHNIIGNISMHNGGGAAPTYRANLVLNNTNNYIYDNLFRRDGTLEGWDEVDYGIYETADGDYNMIFLNDVRGNPTPMVISGANTIAKHNPGYITENSGTATGTGAQQAIAHGCSFTPTKAQVIVSNIDDGANPYLSADPDATYIYVTAVSGKAYRWEVKMVP